MKKYKMMKNNYKQIILIRIMNTLFLMIMNYRNKMKRILLVLFKATKIHI